MSGMGRSVSGWAMKLQLVRHACFPSATLLGYTFEHRPGLEDKGRERYSTEVGARPQLRNNVGEHIALLLVHNGFVFMGYFVPVGAVIVFIVPLVAARLGSASAVDDGGA